MASPNLVPLQIDQTTGNLVAKALAGTYVPPSGTGFQYVTNGAPSTTAITATQATALLNLFTSSLQGVVPPSAGGTTNYLRADGTWASPPGVGTVTSVALADGSTTSIYSVTGSPVTGTGTLTFTLKSQNANLVFAGPLSGVAAQPGFRALVAADIPSISLTTGVSGTLQAAQFPALTGDITTTAGTLATTLATQVGLVGGAYNNVTVNTKGLVTAASNVAYLTANQPITLSGDVSGGGTTSITTSLATIATAGTYKSVTINAKGLVTTGTNPTTLAGFGITDAVSSAANTTMTSGVTVTFVGGGTVTGLPTPVGSTDAAPKSYVDGTVSNGTFTGSLTGMTAATTGTINYVKSRDRVTLYAAAAITGTSNATTMTMTGLPAALYPTTATTVSCWGLEDNGNTNVFGNASVSATGTITFNLAVSQSVAPNYVTGSGPFVSSGVKGLDAGWAITYAIL